jgi:hypothetical protein
MIWVWLMLSFFTAANGVWLLLNWCDSRDNSNEALQIAAQKAEAQNLLRNAKNISWAADIDRETKVCSECHRLVVRHTTDENGKTTCINCSATLARANG